MNDKNDRIELGGISGATMSRLQQFKCADLFRLEICILLYRYWQFGISTMTLYHDETSQNGHSQFSIIMAFNVEYSNAQLLNENYFIPKRRAGNIVRAIWHNNIPSKDAKSSVQWAVKPAINSLDKMGYELYDNWTDIKSLIDGTLGTMTDQNTTALLINKLIGRELDIEELIESICGMHNVDNSIQPALDRLKQQRLNDKEDKNILCNSWKLDILSIANKMQNVLNIKNDNLRNKGHIYEEYERKQKSHKYTKFARVIGDRKINQLKNIDAILTRRDCIKKFAELSFNNQHLIYNARIAYEYGNSQVLLRESIIMTNIRRLYASPLLVTIGKDKPLMNIGLPVIKQALDSMKLITKSHQHSINVLAPLLLLTSLYDCTENAMIRNDLLCNDEKLFLIEIGEYINTLSRHNSEGIINLEQFLTQCQEKIRRKNIVFNDNYYKTIFNQTALELSKILSQLKGAYGNIYDDMILRYELQNKNAPNSTFTNNDITESLNGASKYQQRKGPSTTPKSREGSSFNSINCDAWNTFDYLSQNETMEFKRIILIWHNQYQSYHTSMKNKEFDEEHYNRHRTIKNRRILRATTTAIPAATVNNSNSTNISIIKTDYVSISNSIWTEWTELRDSILRRLLGQRVRSQRTKLKEILQGIMKKHKTHTNSMINRTGLASLQNKLYEYCKAK